ncbi:hypothetical protein [Sphaerotilus mobilis]|uniref:Uncharacterized protein n=1 Tax=Sphaerotilus mobilis TaxID=47994 RepID=A0A4Q7LSY6_9BURK|nr:hypothetical protein [Sphaerotilus mobilis]RZS57976.1 hypothetical protein EV685_0252 [Sphaerotilus mobilis]
MSPDACPHLILPHASALSDAALAALNTLRLPTLQALLARLSQVDDTDRHLSEAQRGDEEYTLSAPHETLLAHLHGWQGADGLWPLAAHAAAADGLDVVPGDPLPWGLVTPVHWQVGSDSVNLIDPAQLQLTEAESRTLFELLRPSFEAEGWQLLWGAPLRWYARHPGLATLALASPDRAIGRSLDLWLGKTPEARRARRLQVEAQMLWHEHPLNEARDAARQWTVNSFWLSGCGIAQPAAPLPGVTVDERLRSTLLAGDWPGWVAAWQALEAGTLADLLARARAGLPLAISLCGERRARTWRQDSAGTWQRLGHGLRERFLKADGVAVVDTLKDL